jgi:hypothetical protein
MMTGEERWRLLLQFVLGSLQMLFAEVEASQINSSVVCR